MEHGDRVDFRLLGFDTERYGNEDQADTHEDSRRSFTE
jgi:hypothetical protein